MKKATTVSRIGLSIGVLLFIAGLGGGFFWFEVLGDTSLLDTAKEDWILFSLIRGLPLCALAIVVGMFMIQMTMNDALTTDRRRTAGWVIFSGGIILLIYLAQYYFTGLRHWFTLGGVPDVFTTEDMVPLALIVVYPLSIIFAVAIITVGLLEALRKKKSPVDKPVP